MSHLRSFVILKQQLILPYYRHYVAKIGTQYRHYGRIIQDFEFNKLRRCDIIGKIKESQIRHYLISITYIRYSSCKKIVRRTFTFYLVYPLRGIGCVCFHFLLIYIPYGKKLIINRMYMYATPDSHLLLLRLFLTLYIIKIS